MAKLAGSWTGPSGSPIVARGSTCCFDHGEAHNIMVENDAVRMNGWTLVSFAQDGDVAYWQLEGDMLHWTREPTTSESDAESIHTGVATVEETEALGEDLRPPPPPPFDDHVESPKLSKKQRQRQNQKAKKGHKI